MFVGHRDGVWQVTHARNGSQVIGTASAGKGSSLQQVTFFFFSVQFQNPCIQVLFQLASDFTINAEIVLRSLLIHTWSLYTIAVCMITAYHLTKLSGHFKSVRTEYYY